MSLKRDSHDETRVALLENNYYHICKTLDRIEDNLKLSKTEIINDINDIDSKIDKVNEKIWTLFLWMISTVTVPICTAMLVYIAEQMIKYFHLIK